MPLSNEQVLAALRSVKDPKHDKDIIAMGMVSQVLVQDASVKVTLNLSGVPSPLKDTVQRDLTSALRQAGAEGVTIDIAPSAAAAPTPAASTTGAGLSQDVPPAAGAIPAARLAPAAPVAARPPAQPQHAHGPGAGGHSHGHTHGPAPTPANALPQVKYVIAVGAGKGGVGKSSVAVNLAVGLARQGLRAGLMDGDIYGPSAPSMLGLKGAEPQLRDGKMIPFFVHGIHAITIGVIVGEDQPLIWRGPMAHGAFKQLLIEKTDWPELDYLIVDLPPGTGDVPLTLCQLLPLTGAVVVATPQQVALDDAIRAVRMFQQLQAPVLGFVENMSYIPLPGGQTLDMFGRGGAEKAAQKLGLPFLGAIPMYQELRINSDSGQPHKNFEGEAGLAAALMHVVENLVGQVSLRSLSEKAPELNIS